MPDLNAKLCEILEVEYQDDNNDTDLEYIQRRNEKLRILSAITDDKEILDNIDIVVMNQDELFDILDYETDIIYLYGEEFFIEHLLFENVCFMGVGHEKPIISLFSSSHNPLEECAKKGITFENVRYNIFIHTYAHRLYENGKYDLAFPVLLSSALDGDMLDQFRVGVMYHFGYGVSQDYAEAVKWYRKAAEQESVNGQMNLGVMYQYGYGVSQDYAEAVKWYRKAAEQGYASGQSNLGVMYQFGYGVSQDYTEAVKWYRKAAEQGDKGGQNNLGTMYLYGYGVSQDYAEAVKWYRKAAEQGNETAINNLKNLGVSI